MNYYIQPSDCFTQKTLDALHACVARKRLKRDLFLVGLGILPFIVREAWFFVRGDYFSVAPLPMGHYIIGVYRLFLSPQTGYVLGSGAVVLLVIYFAKTKIAPYSTIRLS